MPNNTETKAQFTPGPWSLHADTPLVVVRGGFTIGAFQRPEDSRLAAAAPDLYEAVRDVVEERVRRALAAGARSASAICAVDPLNPCWDGRPDDVAGQHWGGGSSCIWCNAHAALAKARG